MNAEASTPVMAPFAHAHTEPLRGWDPVPATELPKGGDRSWEELVDWFDRQREWIELLASFEGAR
jgi:hypothetical protein